MSLEVVIVPDRSWEVARYRMSSYEVVRSRMRA